MRHSQERYWARDLVARIKVDEETECWVWTGAKQKGYARVFIQRKVVYIHRLVYERYIGPIPKGNDIHHTCLNRACVNPDHLQSMDHATHTRLHGGR